MDKRLLKRVGDETTGEYIERICHYKGSRPEMVGCFRCDKRASCNSDIFSKLADFEDTGLQPEDVRKLKELAFRRKGVRLTISNSDGTVSQPTETTVESVFYKLSRYEDIGISPDDLKEMVLILSLKGS